MQGVAEFHDISCWRSSLTGFKWAGAAGPYVWAALFSSAAGGNKREVQRRRMLVFAGVKMGPGIGDFSKGRMKIKFVKYPLLARQLHDIF